MECTRCIMNDTIPNIKFDENGICSYCNLHDSMEREYPTGAHGQEKLFEIVKQIKEDGQNKKYDCVVGVSGGCDSSLLLWKVKEYGLRPLAITFDNTWSTVISTQNINNICEKLAVDLYTYVVDGEEFNDISRSFLKASVPDADCPNDIAITTLYYKTCNENDVNYFICGHSFRTEGTVPLGWTYMDGKYIQSVQQKFGTMPIKTFLNLDIDFWLKNIHRKRIRMLYYMDYNKEEVKKSLADKFGWKWYGGHHHENEYTKFVKSVLLPQKFKIDKRYVEFSALVRSGNMTRQEAKAQLESPETVESGFLGYVLKRLKLTKEDFADIMASPVKSYHDYETYREYFIEHREMFREMMEKGLIPRTFFEKYTK